MLPQSGRFAPVPGAARTFLGEEHAPIRYVFVSVRSAAGTAATVYGGEVAGGEVLFTVGPGESRGLPVADREAVTVAVAADAAEASEGDMIDVAVDVAHLAPAAALGGSARAPIFAELSGLVPLAQVYDELVVSSAVSVPAGAFYDSANVDLSGYRWAVAGVGQVTGTGLDYEIALYTTFPLMANGLAIDQLDQSGNTGAQASANGGNSAAADHPTAATYARVTNASTSDALTFAQMEIVAGG